MNNSNLPAIFVCCYTVDDADATLALFQRAVFEVASKDYIPAQIEAWAGTINRAIWTQVNQHRSMWIALMDVVPVGLADLTNKEHLDMLFVSPDHQRCSVTSALMNTVEQTARRRGLSVLPRRPV